MSRSICEDTNGELFMDALSDCSENSVALISDCESDDNDSIVALIRQSNRRMLLSESEGDSSDDMEEDIIAGDVDDWTENDAIVQLEPYGRTSSINTMSQDHENIWEAAQLFLGDDLFELLVTETNRYRSHVAIKYKEYKAVKWVDVTVTEMKKFLGLIILMGQVPKGDMYDYWSTLSYIETPIFPKTMSRNRFMQIWRMWHFCNNDLLHDETDKLFKIREVLNYMQHKFETVYTPKQQLSLDEGVIPWRDRLFFRTYNPAKIVKYGILVRMLCEATSGYICNFKVYSGSEATLESTVLTILDPYVGFHHHVYMDNYYNSVHTAELLLQKKTRVRGTIRANRGLPRNLKNVTLKQHESKFARKRQVLLHVWQATKNRTVRTISTIHSAEMVNVPHWSGMTTKPKSVVEYNKYMKGVDHADQYMSYYNILRKSTKWTKKAVLYFFNAALFNSFLVYRKTSHNRTTYKKFLLEVAIALVETKEEEDIQNIDTEQAGPSNVVQPTRRAPRHDPPGCLSQDFKKHKLVPIITNGKKKYPHRRCRVCSANKKSGYTRYVCEFSQFGFPERGGNRTVPCGACGRQSVNDALNLAVNNNDRNFLLFSDALSVLSSLNSSKMDIRTNSYILNIKKLYNRFICENGTKSTIKFYWIPSHIGIAGNERAGQLAKEASQSGSLNISKIPFTDLYESFRKDMFYNTNSTIKAEGLYKGKTYFKKFFRENDRFPWFLHRSELVNKLVKEGFQLPMDVSLIIAKPNIKACLHIAAFFKNCNLNI
ncbi:PiggyBac transposable element-derived protein 4 [Anthophora plagiata]